MMQSLVEDIDLSHLSPELRVAAIRLADLKYHIDVTGRRCPADISNDLHGRERGGEYDGPYGGDTFLASIIPFISYSPIYEMLGVKNIPIAHTLGRSWRWWPEHSKGDEEKIIKKISSPEYGKDAYYYLIKELGVIYASEGKNRVNFCRHHNIEKIPVTAVQFGYPAADRINIYQVNSVVGAETIAVLDGRYFQRMKHIGYALPLLNAYGVRVHTKWPLSFPSFECIYEHAADASVEHMFMAHTIDMEKVLGEEVTKFLAMIARPDFSLSRVLLKVLPAKMKTSFKGLLK